MLYAHRGVELSPGVVCGVGTSTRPESTAAIKEGLTKVGHNDIISAFTRVPVKTLLTHTFPHHSVSLPVVFLSAV